MSIAEPADGLIVRVCYRERQGGPLLHTLLEVPKHPAHDDTLLRIIRQKLRGEWRGHRIERIENAATGGELPLGGGRRTQPGEGDMIAIYLLDAVESGIDHITCNWVFGDTIVTEGIVEDFSTCGWPIAVKVKADCPPDVLVRSLRDLADQIVQARGVKWELDSEGDPAAPQARWRADADLARVKPEDGQALQGGGPYPPRKWLMPLVLDGGEDEPYL